jgi:tetratricopeptide (TPR) repeat protein
VQEAEQVIDATLAWSRSVGDREGIARASLCLGEIRRQQRRWAAGISALQRGLESLEGLGFHPLRARTVHNLGEIHRSAGDPDAAAPCYAEAAAWFARIGDENAAWFARLNMGLNDVQRGEHDRAEPTLRAVTRLEDARGLGLLQTMARAALLGMAARRGELGAFDEHMERLEVLAERTGYVDVDLIRHAGAALPCLTTEPARRARLERFLADQRARLPS